MNKPKRVARKIGQTDKDEATDNQPSISFVKRPAAKSKRSNTSKVRATYDDDETTETPAVIKPKKLTARRDILEQPIGRTAAHAQPAAAEDGDEDPYSAANMATMKRTMQAPPPKFDESDPMIIDEPEPRQAIQEDPPPPTQILRADEAGGSAIPTDAEIREKKERRRRLAMEAQAGGTADDFIPLDGPGAPKLRRASDASDMDSRMRSLITKAEEYEGDSKWGESRLIHEDEDIAEGFDDFVEDSGRVALGKRGLKKQERERRRDIERQINTAQGGDEDGDVNMEDEVDEEEAARLRAYEASQTKAGSYGHKSSRQREKEREEQMRRRLEVLPRMKPIPTMSEVAARFRNTVTEKQNLLAKTRETVERTTRELEEIAQEEIRIKALLQEAGERFEKLRADLAYPRASMNGAPDPGRGLESLAGVSAQSTVGSGGQHSSGMGGMPADEYD